MFPHTDPVALPAPLQRQTETALNAYHTAIRALGLACPQPLAAVAQWFTASPFIAAYAQRAPAAFTASLQTPDFGSPRDFASYAALLAPRVAETANETDLRRVLRNVRNQELVRIACRDLAGQATLEAVLSELSALADSLIRAALDWLTGQFDTRYGVPRDPSGTPVRLLVLAMGKLGGKELNFSSDIDLIFLFRAQGETTGARRAISHQEYFDRLGKQLIGLLHDPTADGFVYRVDMRLRPFGESGALTISFSAFEHYLEVHGRDWERYALIKGRLINGTMADQAALETLIRPFVFRRYLDFGALEAVRSMKVLIQAEVARYGLEEDVKRGSGGIREIEFIGQTFQLIRGGRESRLRAREIRTVLEACADLRLLASTEVDGLLSAYRFLRITEHRLQQVQDEQTQALPSETPARVRLAFGMGFSDWDTFKAALDVHRACVQQSFFALLGPPPTMPKAPREIALLWPPLRPFGDAAEGALPNHLVAAARALAPLQEPRFLARLSPAARARLDRLMPAVLTACSTGAEAAETLHRVAGLIRSVARRSVYLALLADQPQALRHLITLCQASGWIARELTTNPILLDELLDLRNLLSPPTRSGLEAALHDALVNAAEGGLEELMEVLRVFKHQQVLRVAASELMAGYPVARVSNQLTCLAETLIDQACTLALRELNAKHGRPVRHIGGRIKPAGFAIIAYGKLGGRELGYGSDLDLVFIHDSDLQADETGGPKPISNDLFFTRLAQRIIHLLATRTAAGAVYELDVRLRPSGAAGLLVTSINAFGNYQREAAWTWEHQALVRARAVVGHPETREAFERIRREILRRPRGSKTLKKDICAMQSRMRGELDRSDTRHFDLKHGRGGITDIEFVVQYVVLRWAWRHPVLAAYTDNLRLLELIADLGLVSRIDSRLLREAYFAYRAEVHRCALQEIDGLVDHACFSTLREAVSAVWSRVMQN